MCNNMESICICWTLCWTANKTRIGVFVLGQILCISPNGLQPGHCDAPPPHFGWPKMNFDRISRHFREIRNFFSTKWLPAAILDDRKSLSTALLAISDQYTTFIFFTKWLPAAFLDDRKSLSIAFLAISDQYATFCSTKWLPSGILGDRKSLFIAFLAISDQYATLIFFSQNGCRRPFWMTFLAISDKYFWMTEYHFWISRRFRSIRNFFFWVFFFKMAAGGHFGSPIWAILDDRKSLSNAFLAISDQYITFFLLICAKNNRVLPLCVINGYAKYEVDRWICDTVRDGTSFLSIFIQNGRY